MSKFKAVLFDLGGTLKKTVEAAEIFRRILEKYGVSACSEVITKAHKESEHEFSVETMVELKEGFWIKYNSHVLEKLGINKSREFLAKKSVNCGGITPG